MSLEVFEKLESKVQQAIDTITLLQMEIEELKDKNNSLSQEVQNAQHSREDLEQTLLRYVALYNHQLPQSALKSKTPMQTMKDWYKEHPHLFHKRPYDRPGCDR